MEQKIRDHSAERHLFLSRVFWGMCLLILLTIILLATIFRLQILHFAYYSAESIKNSIELIIVPPERGLIYDRHNTPIAKNESVYQIEIIPDKDKIPKHFDSLDDELAALSSIIELSEEEIAFFKDLRIHYAMHRSVPLKNNITMQEVYQFSAKQHLFSNVSITQTQHRYYPYGEALAHVVGYMSKISDKDRARLKEIDQYDNYKGTYNIGKSGVEKYYEDLLHGQIGYKKVEITSRRKIVRELENEPAKAGKDIYLSIDLPLQLYIYELLKDRRAAVVAIDPRNGEILALVSTPSFDPNLFVGGISSKDYNSLRNNRDIPLYNRATLGGYSPASTIKPFMAVSALSEGVITPKTVMNHPGYWQLPNSTRKFRDWRRWGHGKVDVRKSLAESVDTFYYQVAYDMGIDRINEWMGLFGFGSRSGIDLDSGEESAAILPSREWKHSRYKQQWIPGDTVSVGIGQGYWTSTPIQLAKALTILINEGKTFTPHLLMSTSELGHPLNYTDHLESNYLTEAVNPKFWQLAKEGMHDVLFSTNGTARKIFLGSPYKAAGKSGTAQVFSLKENEEYNGSTIAEHLKDNALFIAYAPYEDPTIALVVVLEHGGSGSSVGGAIAKKILDYYLLGINEDESDDD